MALLPACTGFTLLLVLSAALPYFGIEMRVVRGAGTGASVSIAFAIVRYLLDG